MRSSLLAACAFGLFVGLAPAQDQPQRAPDVPYVPTPEPVVQAMLKLAGVQKNDVVYDLGCGDGRIVITAAKQYGARGVGVDINPERIREARANAKAAGVEELVKFVEADLFQADIKEATVVTLYLLPNINLKLRPKLWSDLKPGTRVVSHAFDMGDWKPEKTDQVDFRNVYYWTIPATR
jgi:SAM-dependent methyltransferase